MTGLGDGAAGIDPERVAEVLVELGRRGPGRRGSGYRISPEAVLTAAHVVRDANRVRVRFDADRSGEWVAEGRVAWSDPGVDVAVVTITPRPGDEGQVEPVGFGRVAERDAVLECSAMGFPLFKLRDDPAPPGGGTPSRYRDSVHAVGTIAVLSNRREGTLEVSVAAPERDPDPAVSPWGGMSGAAVWSAGRVVGLVAEHHRSDGLGRLAATRVDRWHERLSPARLGELCGLTGLPATLEGLREVVPLTGSELVEAGYQAQVRDIAPVELRGREQELAELVRFCAGDEPYQWWLAEAWAGKSALAAWFVLHPPAGVRVASFFVTRRLAGQADSDAFTEAMVEQLAVIADEPAAQAATPAGRDRERSRLLELAARRVGEGQGRLLVVVDGLDEDEGARPASGRPSIASLLPRRPAANVRVLVTSRPHPGIPGDVPGGHPLRHCVPRLLDPSPFAHDIEVAAKNELMEQLHGDQLQVDILGCVTAAGGGLTLADLAELTGSPQWALDGKLWTVFGRSLMTRAQRGPLPTGPEDVVYLFAHETLGEVAEETLGNDLRPYRRRIDGWAGRYRERGWPAETPQYLLRPYSQLLGDHGEVGRLVELATDHARHDRLLAATLGDGDAIAEITKAQQLLLGRAVPDLATLGRLAVHRDRLASRNELLPIGLPGLLVRLGQRRRGEAIALSMPRHSRPRALGGVARALADLGRWDRAEQTARGIPEGGPKAEALAEVGRTLVAVDRERALGLLEEAEKVARGVRDSHVQPFAMAAVAEAHADAGLWERAERTAHAIEPMYAAAGARALRSVAGALAATGQWDRAERTARAIPDIWEKAAAMASLGGALTDHDHDRAVKLLRDAEGLARGHHLGVEDDEPLRAVLEPLLKTDRARAFRLIADLERAAERIPNSAGIAAALVAIASALADLHLWEQADRVVQGIADPFPKAEATLALARALAEAGQWDRAEGEARGIPEPRIRAGAMIVVASAMAPQHPDRALAVAADAERTARAIPRAGRFWALEAVTRAYAAAGQPELAERAARDLAHPAQSLRAVAGAQARAGQWDRAERTVLAITEAGDQVMALVAVAAAMGGAGMWDRAERTARHATGQRPLARAEVLGALAEAAAGTDPARAAALAADALLAAGGVTDARDQVMALAAAARALAAAGRWDDAEVTARRIADPDAQVAVLGAVCSAMTAVDPRRARALADETERDVRARLPAQPLVQATGLARLAGALAGTDRERAVGLAAEAEQAGNAAEDNERDQAMVRVAKAQAAVGRWDHAERAARAIASTDNRTQALGDLAGALIHTGQWDHAQRIANDITAPRARVDVLGTLAGALAELDPDRALALVTDAEATVRTVPDLFHRAQAWNDLVRSLTAAATWPRTSDYPLHQRLRRLLAEILAGERWLDALEPLGRLDPAALAAVDRELHA